MCKERGLLHALLRMSQMVSVWVDMFTTMPSMYHVGPMKVVEFSFALSSCGHRAIFCRGFFLHVADRQKKSEGKAT